MSANEPRPKQQAAFRDIAPPIKTDRKNCSTQPATFSRVNFFKAAEIRALSSFLSSRDINGCQSSATCFFVKRGDASCPCDPPEHLEPSVVSANLGDTGAGCWQTFNTDKVCETENNGIQFCQWAIRGASCAQGDPTPTPTPEPTPTPSPTAMPSPTPSCTQQECQSVNPCGYCNPNPMIGCELPPCPNGPTQNFVLYPQTGCPGNAYPGAGACWSGEGGCCRCNLDNPTSPSGYAWNRAICQCVSTSQPPPQATPDTPPPDYGSGPGNPPSPILIDTLGDGFRLTDAAGVVSFDLDSDGRPERLSWTAAGAADVRCRRADRDETDPPFTLSG